MPDLRSPAVDILPRPVELWTKVMFTPAPRTAPCPIPRQRVSKRGAAWVSVGICFVTLLTGATVCLVLARHAARNGIPTHTVHYETVQPSIIVRGDVESSETTDIVCRVRSWSGASTPATTIKWVVDNGSRVKRGQLLVELDDSGLKERLKEKVEQLVRTVRAGGA